MNICAVNYARHEKMLLAYGNNERARSQKASANNEPAAYSRRKKERERERKFAPGREVTVVIV